MMSVSPIIAVIGAWVACAPFFNAGNMFYAWNDWAAGAVVFVLSFGLARISRPAGTATALAAAWLVASGFFPSLHSGAGLWWNDVAVGVVFIVCSLAFSGMTHHHHHPQAA